MQLGELDQRVTLRRKVEQPNEYGTLERVDSDIATVWANVRPMSGRERDYAQQQDTRANYAVTIRNRTDLKDGDYVFWRGKEMKIQFIPDAGPRPQYLKLECELGAP